MSIWNGSKFDLIKQNCSKILKEFYENKICSHINHFLTVNPARAAVTTHADNSPFTTSFGQSLTPIEPFRVRQHALQEADLIWPHSDINKVETSKKSDKKPKRLTFCLVVIGLAQISSTNFGKSTEHLFKSKVLSRQVVGKLSVYTFLNHMSDVFASRQNSFSFINSS